MQSAPLASTPLKSALLAALLVLGATPALAKSGANGKVSIDDAHWAVADAVATLDGDELKIVFASKEFDRAAWAEDGQFGSFDLWEFKDDDGNDGQSLSITVDNESGGYGGHGTKTGFGGGGGYSSDYAESLKLSVRDDKHVAGTLKITDDDLAAEVTFDLPIQTFGPLTRPGTALPADGGEPGKALKAVVDATHAGNLDQMIALSHPEKRKQIEQAKASGEAAKMLELAKLFTPRISKVIGGSIDGDSAWVDFEGQEDGGKVTGTAELSRMNGQWFVKKINTRSGG
ncbi:MAG: hypothetical protein LKM32_06095 [Chiayiivirga sp.]|uniref:hypothetical protein n=1 Tax=Chiayiivirga sp. TaxID=2041042 RepID=UPI0025C56821|nr:hypothetical protein [Chiayiivirga sp.]MCI1710243.1 hypothetical protein [Chiayiivirga sp.]MCI1728963.1 hypothetical protein [Chiayiivirga sp.]